MADIEERSDFSSLEEIEEESEEASDNDGSEIFPDEIKNFRPPQIGGCCNNQSCSEGEIILNDEKPKKQRKRKQSKDENLTSKRIVAFFMVFPMIVAAGVMVYDSMGRFKWQKTVMQITAAVGGAAIAITFLYKIPGFRNMLRVALCFFWVIFLVPTYQVYKCSPFELKNDMLGTWFSLKTEAPDFLKSTYITSICFKEMSFHTPYSLSLMSPKISLKVDINDMISLQNKPGREEANNENAPSYFLLVSKRSVKRKYHKIYLMVEASQKEAEFLKKSVVLPNNEKTKNLLLLTGTVVNLSESMLPLKKELEDMSYLVRPIKFKLKSVKYINRYAKLRDDTLY